MESLLEIEEAIGRLPKDQMMALMERVADEWDRKFERDVTGGRLNEVAQRALAEHRAGQQELISKQHPNETTLAAMNEATEGLPRFSLHADLIADLNADMHEII